MCVCWREVASVGWPAERTARSRGSGLRISADGRREIRGRMWQFTSFFNQSQIMNLLQARARVSPASAHDR